MNVETANQTESTEKKITAKLFGIGTAGLNVIEALIRSGLPARDFVAVASDARSLAASSAFEKIVLSPHSENPGLNCATELATIGPLPFFKAGRCDLPAPSQNGTKPDNTPCPALDGGEGTTHGSMAVPPTPATDDAASADAEASRVAASPPDIIFLIAGLGGITSASIIPAIARSAKETGALVLAIVTLPFDCEGSHRQRLAQRALEELKSAADGVICLPNQKILKLIDENTSVLNTFKLTNELLADGVRGLWRLLCHRGLIQIHFADLAALLRERHGESCFAVAEASGATRSREAVEKLLAHPMLEGGQALTSADAVLVSLVSSPDLTMAEVNRVMEQINKHCQQAQVIMGAAIDDSFADRLVLTVVATRAGLEEDRPVNMPRSNGEELDTQLLTSGSGPRSNSRFVPPAPALPPEKVEQLLTRQSAPGLRPRKRMTRLRQGQLPLEIISKGRFDKTDPTIVKGEDLDVPTYVRRGVALN